DRLAWKVPLKMRFVDGDILDTDDALQPLHFQNAVNHQKRIAVGQDLLDLCHVKDHARCLRNSPCPCLLCGTLQTLNYTRRTASRSELPREVAKRVARLAIG